MHIQKNKNGNSTIFYCFSPPVMIATFVIEGLLAIYVACKYKLTLRARIIVALLVCLGGFQLAEYFVCTTSSIAITAARLGFVAITFLPALGLHLMSSLTKPIKKLWLTLTYMFGVIIAAYFLIAPQAFDGYQCTGNYVIFQIGYAQASTYSVYYFGVIAASIAKGIRFLQNKARKGRAAIKWLLAGYAFFILPVAFLTVLHPDTTHAIPSILCGFAVTLAVVLTSKVSPLSLQKK